MCPLKEKVNRNKIIVALHICGFNQRVIADFVKSDRRNVQFFIKKYTKKYFDEVIKAMGQTILKEEYKKKENNNKGRVQKTI